MTQTMRVKPDEQGLHRMLGNQDYLIISWLLERPINGQEVPGPETGTGRDVESEGQHGPSGG